MNILKIKKNLEKNKILESLNDLEDDAYFPKIESQFISCINRINEWKNNPEKFNDDDLNGPLNLIVIENAISLLNLLYEEWKNDKKYNKIQNNSKINVCTSGGDEITLYIDTIKNNTRINYVYNIEIHTIRYYVYCNNNIPETKNLSSYSLMSNITLIDYNKYKIELNLNNE